MVKDGIYYSLGMFAAAAALTWVSPWLALPPVLLAAFFLWFFRDPERQIPVEAGQVVSPADGKVTCIATTTVEGKSRTRISIFLNVFNVHVNRSPIAGVIKHVQYQKGKFGNAMGAGSSDDNEQNIVTVEGEGKTVIFKQIAGLLARRIVFNPAIGESVARGQRIGLIKFGSRVDVLLPEGVRIWVKLGDHVAGGSSVLASFRDSQSNKDSSSDKVPTGMGA